MMTTSLATQTLLPHCGDAHTLAGEHAQLLRDVTHRAAPVLALLDTRAWPYAELGGLVGQLRSDVLRQASDEETHLFPHDTSAPPFAELSADHVRLHTLIGQLEKAHATPCSRAELRALIEELLATLRRHLDDEQHVLAAAAATTDSDVPNVAELSATEGGCVPDDDAPIRIDLAGLPAAQAFELCIGRLLRLRRGQSAELHTVDAQLVAALSRWLHDFDAAQFGLAHLTEGQGQVLRVTRRHQGTPGWIGYPG